MQLICVSLENYLKFYQFSEKTYIEDNWLLDDMTSNTNNWIKQHSSGTLTRSNGVLTFKDGSYHFCAYYNAKIDGDFEVTYEVQSGSYDIFALGIDPSNDYKRVGIQPAYDMSEYSGDKIISDAPRKMISYSYSYPATIKLQRIGYDVKLYINDEYKDNFTADFNLDGYVGIQQSWNRTTKITNFKIRKL